MGSRLSLLEVLSHFGMTLHSVSIRTAAYRVDAHWYNLVSVIDFSEMDSVSLDGTTCDQWSALEAQILEFLEEISLPERFQQCVLARHEQTNKAQNEQIGAQKRSLLQAQTASVKELDNLTKLRIRDLLTDEEYLKQRNEIERQQLGIAQRLGILNQNQHRFEPAQLLISLNNRLVSCFTSGDLHKRRLILNTVSSNLVLKDKKLSIDARKPFRRWANLSTHSELRAYLEDIRTFVATRNEEVRALASSIKDLLADLDDDGGKKAA